MKDYLIEFSAYETYHGNKKVGKVLVSAENSEKAWERAQELALKDLKAINYSYNYGPFSLIDSKILTEDSLKDPQG